MIVAIVGEEVVDGCAIEDTSRHWHNSLVVGALEAQEQAVAQALIRAIWARATFFVVEDVPPEAEVWWCAEGFERSAVRPLSPENGRVNMSRFRWDALGDEEPLEPFWPTSVPLGDLLRQEAEW